MSALTSSDGVSFLISAGVITDELMPCSLLTSARQFIVRSAESVWARVRWPRSLNITLRFKSFDIEL